MRESAAKLAPDVALRAHPGYALIRRPTALQRGALRRRRSWIGGLRRSWIGGLRFTFQGDLNDATHPSGSGAWRPGCRRHPRARQRRDHLSLVRAVWRRPRRRWRAELRLLDVWTVQGHGLRRRRLLRAQSNVPGPATRDDPTARAERTRLLLGRAQERSVLRRHWRVVWRNTLSLFRLRFLAQRAPLRHQLRTGMTTSTA